MIGAKSEIPESERTLSYEADKIRIKRMGFGVEDYVVHGTTSDVYCAEIICGVFGSTSTLKAESMCRLEELISSVLLGMELHSGGAQIEH